ncbi:FAD-binding oxidoreductase [Thermodesulfobacteriota bacterium]
MIPAAAIKKLSDIVGHDYLITGKADLADYATDATKLKYLPDVVALPADAEEISRILLLANQQRFPVVPRGAGSGKSGGALPVGGGLVVAMDRLNRILEIDQDNLIAKVEPAVITARLQDEVEKLGLFYPPDPASYKISTIGGNVAECAGGLRAVKYGVTRDYVLGLTVVLPTGEIIKTGVETTKGVAGYDLTRLIVGSEGTLAIITSITLRLIPKPATQKTMIAFFRTASTTVDTVANIIRNKIIPTTLEFMDKLCLQCVQDDIHFAIPSESEAVLLIEVDGNEEMTDLEAAKIREICLESGALEFEQASDFSDAQRLWELRRNISEALFKLGPDKISEDIVVPRSRTSDLVSLLETLGQEFKLSMPAFGHAGDGNIHVNIMLDNNNPDDVKNALAAVWALFEGVLKMNGTISGEHGIGITKAPYLAMEISRPALNLMTRLKQAFDPHGILNPNKIFASNEWQ